MSSLIVSSRRTLHPGPPRPDRVAVAVAPRPRRALVWLPEVDAARFLRLRLRPFWRSLWGSSAFGRRAVGSGLSRRRSEGR